VKTPTNLRVFDEDALECSETNPYHVIEAGDEPIPTYSKVGDAVCTIFLGIVLFLGSITFAKIIVLVDRYIFGDHNVSFNPWR
jgi:hypothetical protein